MTDFSQFSETELVKLLFKRDVGAYTEIYNRFWSVMFKHAKRMLQNEEDAKNVVQDVFEMLWNKAEGLELSGSLPAYLYAATRNRILNIFRKNKLASEHLATLDDFDVDAEGITDHLVREHELAAIIEQEINALPEKMRRVFLMKRNENLSYKDIAAQTGTTELTVKTQMTNALRVLRKKLGPSRFHSGFPFL